MPTGKGKTRAYFIRYGIKRLRARPNTFWTTRPSPIVRDLSRGDAISEYNVYVIGPTALLTINEENSHVQSTFSAGKIPTGSRRTGIEHTSHSATKR